MNTIAALVLLLSALAGIASARSSDPLTVQELRCEYRTNPLGVGTLQPRLGWKLEARERGQRQTACQILVATSASRLQPGQADLWDSGRLTSGEPIQHVYAGKPLTSGQRAWWTVRAWDRDGKASAWAPAAWWEQGLAPSDWKARWITSPGEPPPEAELFNDQPAPLFRREFTAAKPVQRARAYVSGLGYYELSLNGRKVGDELLDPGWTAVRQRVLYTAHDVTALVRSGRNAVGLCVGNGWFNPLPLRMWGKINPRQHLTIGKPRAILQLVVEYADGSAETVVTDPTWKSGDSPVRRNSVYLGEFYDATREQAGWDQPGFDDRAWKPAVEAIEKLGPLCAQVAPPIRATRILKPVRLTEPRPGVFVFDFGQNFAGVARLHVAGPAGTKVRLRYGELLYTNGMLNGMTAVCGQIKGGGPDYRYDGVGQPKTAFQLGEYTLKGGGRETWAPRFTYHGFRYVEVTGFPGRPTLDALEGLRLNSDVPPAGTFRCSNELFNRIQEMVLWTELSNLFSVQSDCPHREKFGYGGDIIASAEMALLNFDMSGFYTKALLDHVDAVRPNGGFTETAPFVGIADSGLGEGTGPVGWNSAPPVLLHLLHQHYGERRLMEEHYPALQRWIALLEAKASGNLLTNCLGDHESLAPKSKTLTTTAFYYYNVTLLARIARELGQTADAAAAEALAARIRASYNQAFLDPATGRYDTATQANQAFSLYMGLAPETSRARVLEVLVRDVLDHQKGHLSTGLFGTKYLLNVLTDLGRADVAWTMASQRTFPGWGYMLDNGATTLWERWAWSDNTYSHNHPMLGSVSEWFYKALGGIQPAPDAVGFDRIVIHPRLVGDLTWASATHETVRGTVASDWKKDGRRLVLNVRVPVSARATVFVPAGDQASVTESGQALGQAPGVRFLRMAEGCAVIEVGAGAYTFAATLP